MINTITPVGRPNWMCKTVAMPVAPPATILFGIKNRSMLTASSAAPIVNSA